MGVSDAPLPQAVTSFFSWLYKWKTLDYCLVGQLYKLSTDIRKDIHFANKTGKFATCWAMLHCPLILVMSESGSSMFDVWSISPTGLHITHLLVCIQSKHYKRMYAHKSFNVDMSSMAGIQDHSLTTIWQFTMMLPGMSHTTHCWQEPMLSFQQWKNCRKRVSGCLWSMERLIHRACSDWQKRCGTHFQTLSCMPCPTGAMLTLSGDELQRH